ncbi:MAG: thioredoxin family protein [Thermotogota bacterium]
MGGRLAAVLLLALSFCAVAGFRGSAEDLPVVVAFYEDGCPDCARIDEVLVALASDLPAFAVRRYEISEPGSMRILRRLMAAYDLSETTATVPIVFVGDTVIIGADRAQELKLMDAISRCARSECPSPLARIDLTSFPWKDVARLALLVGLVLLLTLLQFS